MRHCHKPTRRAKIKQNDIRGWQRCGATGILRLLVRVHTGTASLENHLTLSTKGEDTQSPWLSNSTSRNTLNRNSYTWVRNIRENVHTSIICKSPKLQTKISINNRVGRLWCIYTTDYYKAMKMNKTQFT